MQQSCHCGWPLDWYDFKIPLTKANSGLFVRWPFNHPPAIYSLTADCLFMTLNIRKSSYYPVIFQRPSGSVYICGVNDSLTLPESPQLAIPRE